LFLNCDGIEKIVIPDTVTKIGYSAFSGCTNLTEVTVPDSVTEIGRTAFSECTSLTEIIIPDNVIEIGYQCFGNCPSLSIYCRKFSKSAIAAIDSGANILFYDENRREDTKVLDVGKSYFIKQTSDVVKLTCNYSIKDEAYEDINNISIKIKTPPNAEFVQNSLFLDKNLCDNYRENNDSIIVPVVNQSGKITLNFRVKESGVFATYALLNYNFDGVSDYDIIDVISDDKSIITINTDSITNKAEIDVEGVAPSAGDNIVVYVDDTVITTLKANKAADYSGKVSLPDTQDGNTYKIKAVSKTTGDSAETKVMYKENAPKLLSFKMIYKDCEYDLMSNKKHSITYNGANPFTFIVEYENYSGIDTVIVGSTRNQDTKIMKAKWDDELKAYVAQGYFEDADTSYVPGTLSVSYTEKQDDFELNQEWVDEQLEVELPEKLQNYTTEKIENTDTYKEYNISFSDDAEIKYIYEQVSVSDMLSELEEEEEQPQSVAALRTSDKYKLSTGDTGDIIKLIEKITFKGWKLYKKYGTGQEETGYSKIENSGGDIISWWYDPNADYIEKQVISAVKDKSLDYIVDTMVPQAGGFTDLASPMFGTMQSMGAEYLNFCGTVIDVQLAKQEIMMDTSLTDQQRQAKLQQLRDYQNAQLNITCAKIVGECLKYEAGLIAMSGNPIIGGIVWAAGFIIGDIYASNPDGLSKSVLRIKSYFSSPFNWCIDPSGYVYEGVTSNRLKGVTATAYWIPFDEEDEGYWDKPDEDKAIVWDSDEYSQYNPLITDYEGNYAWDVPEGWWRVKYELDGYETCYSEWMKVPPPQTDVNINMKKLANPQVESVCFTDTGDIEIEFDTYMLPETVSNVIVKDWSLNNVEYKLAYSNDETDAEGNVYAKVFTLDADVEMNENVISSITVPDTVLSYAQVSAKFYAKEFERPTEDTTAAESTESTTETDNVQDKLIGDVNLDGTVDIKDVTYIQKYLASLIFLNDYQLARADTNNDGNINIKDATAIQEFLVQLIPKLG
ncbi:MAG: leucine-rich repeat protein, partial [Ruminococcus sp.]|nr:leucine-rich repeat protein [Ruminococcus sp.]